MACRLTIIEYPHLGVGKAEHVGSMIDFERLSKAALFQ